MIQVTVVVVADCTAHGTPPMLTVFLSLPSSHPVQVMVTVVPPVPDDGVTETISGVLLSSYMKPHLSFLHEDMKPLISTLT